MEKETTDSKRPITSPNITTHPPLYEYLAFSVFFNKPERMHTPRSYTSPICNWSELTVFGVSSVDPRDIDAGHDHLLLLLNPLLKISGNSSSSVASVKPEARGLGRRRLILSTSHNPVCFLPLRSAAIPANGITAERTSVDTGWNVLKWRSCISDYA
ncbi:hypothetical protein QQF64_001643 [Cirrhinus molitorella]|uniref:Uncharacterized protein n=1 Tax=Cirrhinus molitorella TaxID=172907 RepID=A0ABR3P0N5_9TELE